MSENFPIATAKKADELAATYAKVKTLSKDFGFSAVTELKVDQVKKAMTDSKKPAEFIVEVGVAKTLIVQLVCDVKGKMRSVLGRHEIKTMEEFKKFKGLAGKSSVSKVAAELLI